MGLERKLAHRDKFVLKLIQSMPGLCENGKVEFPDDTTPVKFVVEMTGGEFNQLYSSLMTGSDLSFPNNAHEINWILLRQVECKVSICDEIIECLQPLFDDITTALQNIQTDVDALQEAQLENSAQEPLEIDSQVESELCGGATAVVESMHNKVMEIYTAQENSLVDSVFEMIPILIELIPGIGSLPFDELFEVVNWHFENQQLDYEADYADLKDEMTCDLLCFIKANGGVFTIEVWFDWVTYLGTTYPTNRAASIFSRYAPLYQTFINQIAALIFGNQSLESYFEELAQVYYTGTQTGGECVCADCECAPILADVDVPGNDTTTTLTSGFTYNCVATGLWNGGAGGDVDADGLPGQFNASALRPDLPLYSMLWRIGTTGTWNQGGRYFTIEADSTGVLYAICNDVPGAYGDNSGEICLFIEEQ
jgi:hypothetical protein